ncbi:hypothetical protein HDR63_03220 [bacterium]|nr:hypothetical protein [bacterium]
MNKILGIEYGRGCLATAIDGGCAHAPAAVKEMFPNADWTMVTADPFDAEKCAADRFGENFEIQTKIYNATPRGTRHVMIGGDHSVNFGHFVALADEMADTDLCLVYIDAHLDIHTPESSRAQASGAPHGTNVRADLGTGDARWLGLCQKCPALKPENVFFLGTRDYEPAEIEFATAQNIFIRRPAELQTPSDWADAVRDIRARIGARPFVVSFDFDAIDPTVFHDVLVPAAGGISMAAAEYLVNAFRDAYSFEFVEYAPSGDAASAAIVQKLVGMVVNA